MATTVDELRKEYPELTAQLEDSFRQTVSQEAVQAEQNRLQEIDAISNLFDPALVQEAKYGETACSAQELSHRAAIAAANQGKNFLTAMQDDARASGSNAVTSTPPAQDGKAAQATMVEQAKADAAIFNKMKEGK